MGLFCLRFGKSSQKEEKKKIIFLSHLFFLLTAGISMFFPSASNERNLNGMLQRRLTFLEGVAVVRIKFKCF